MIFRFSSYQTVYSSENSSFVLFLGIWVTESVACMKKIRFCCQCDHAQPLSSFLLLLAWISLSKHSPFFRKWNYNEFSIVHPNALQHFFYRKVFKYLQGLRLHNLPRHLLKYTNYLSWTHFGVFCLLRIVAIVLNIKAV